MADSARCRNYDSRRSPRCDRSHRAARNHHRDSVTVKVNAVHWYRVSDPQNAVLNVENFRIAVQQVALTGLRNVIGQHDLDEVLKVRDQINGILSRNVAQLMVGNPAALELRRMQMVAEVGAENNSTTVLMMPAEFVHMAGSLSKFLEGKEAPPSPSQ